MALTEDLLRGYTDAILLRMLASGESYGYEMNRTLAQISGGRFDLKEATLYTAFRRLESAGYIRSYWGNEMVGARRRYYSLTEEGRKRLGEEVQAWHETREVLNRLLEEEKEL